jgi:hypothetical protein
MRLGDGRPVEVVVVPDADWPGMWRVRMPDGRLTDVVNLARAKDAVRVLEALDKRRAA